MYFLCLFSGLSPEREGGFSGLLSFFNGAVVLVGGLVVTVSVTGGGEGVDDGADGGNSDISPRLSKFSPSMLLCVLLLPLK